MFKGENAIRLFGITVVFGLLWGIYLLVQSTHIDHGEAHSSHIPENADWVVRLDGAKIIQHGFAEIVLAKKDNALVQEFIDFFEDRETIGVVFNSDFYVFSFKTKDGRQLIGALVNVLDREKFQTSLPSYLNKGKGFALVESQGMILIDPSENPISSEKLNAIALKALQTRSKFDIACVKKPDANAMVEFWSASIADKSSVVVMEDVRIGLNFTSSLMKVDGSSKYSSKGIPMKRELKAEHFHIHSAIIPTALNELVKSRIEPFGLKIPALSAISGNYHYSEAADAGTVLFVPHFDGLISFKKQINLAQFLLEAQDQELITSLTASTFKMGGKKFFYKQIAPTTIYVGRETPGEIGPAKTKLMELSGPTDQLLEFKGGWMTNLLKLSPEYNAGTRFLQSIKNTNISMVSTSKNTCSIQGSIDFKEGHSPIDEFVGFLFRAEFVSRAFDE